ncbi:testis-expressed protein 2 isoform X2 [Leguminivora glycinivorella]|uniref:testis-expressed protein 2 isoform X2 n=1 Tax=Leguminivora glycinivorella TaxID=1035111 RepID=UPI00200F38BF|nr:testis-expressed protein 2 isoform X2 [Leguminivora glycinivorella]
MWKSPNSSLSFRYNANNEELEELYHMCDDDPPTPQNDPPVSQNETASPKKADKSSSILDKYFKSMRPEKPSEKENEDPKSDPKPAEETKPAAPPKEVTSSPMKEYLNRLGKRATTSEGSIDAKESSNETWKIFHDFKFKIAQAVEDIKTRSVEETKEKSVPRENSTSDSEESSAIKDSDQQSVGDTDNQVSSLHSSIQNLSEITQPVTAKPTDRESSLPLEKNNSESSDDTHKNLASESENGTGDLLDDSSMLEVESGVEALEDTNIDALGDANLYKDSGDKPPPVLNILPCTVQRPRTPTHIGSPPSKPNITTETPRNYFFNFTMYILTFLLIVNYFLFPNSHAWNGFLLGVWMFTFASNLKQWFLANYFSTDKEPRTSFFQFRRRSVVPYTYNIPNVKEHRPIKKHEGWINHYRFHEYDAYTYHINKTTTAFIKLEGCNLRISYTKTKIAKRALWDEKIDKVVFYQHRLYNLTGAKVFLLPNGLVSKRQWSKKYPICIALNENETIQVLEKENLPEKKPGDVSESKKKEQESETTETTTSPEKKKRFVWRKKEKSLSQEVDTAGREGLRHRIVRKMHRDKKPDSVSTATEPDSQTEKTLQEELNEDEVTSAPANGKDEALDEDLDDEITRLKEFLDETEPETVEGAAEGEWSLHVKHSKDKHSRLFLFARTGRDKLEWFRRIHQAISEATPSVESSVAEDKSSSDLATDTKEGIEMAVYKVSDKDTVSFPKPNTKANPVPLEGLTVVSDWSSYEKTFWPYLIKIMQTHEENIKQTVDAGVTCDLDPTPIETKGKAKKKRKNDPKSDTPSCDCRQLPAEVSWVNTVLARVMYDVMRDPHIMMRVQNRIQRKLNTLKLPSFMSPLVVTELSLAGACPLVERVGGATWDERGVWLDADLRYDGGAAITILTNINLMKLKEKNLTLEEKLLLTEEHIVESDLMFSGSSMFSEKQLRKRKPAIFDSDVEDSAESSSDDESPPVQPVDSNEAIPTQDIASAAAPESGSSKKKFLRMVDKISTNKYFQQVTDFKYVKRAMEGLSNTDIKLQVEIQGLEGRLALNLPPPPHDRLWLGFRTNPQLILKARPAVGARTLRFAHISNWIEHKLSKEFEKVLVLPNMEDIAVDVMTPTPVFAESL